ncbi:MAG: 3-deoxy-manno-octulosonate cytidylyltransferase [Fidelibacterota bacterium]
MKASPGYSHFRTIIGVIPARYDSSRLPGKPLIPIMGKPMIQHVYERASRSPLLNYLFVATDDVRICEAVENFGGRTIMTSSRHRSGTDRIAEAVVDIECDLVVNIQADEPMLVPEMISDVLSPFFKDAGILFSTLAEEIKDYRDLSNPGIVKLVFDIDRNALYFSRSMIPFCRDYSGGKPDLNHINVYKHIGIYGYRKEFLLKFVSLPPSPLEQLERLEQLRALENGYPVKVTVTRYSSCPVDTPDDLERVRELMGKI